CACDFKPCVRDRNAVAHQVQSHGFEKVIPGNFGGSGNVVLKELAKISMGKCFGGLSNAVRIRKGEIFLGVVVIQKMKQVAECNGATAHLPQLQVEQHAQ